MLEDNGSENGLRAPPTMTGKDSFPKPLIPFWDKGVEKLVSRDTMPVCIGIDTIGFTIKTTQRHINMQKL